MSLTWRDYLLNFYMKTMHILLLLKLFHISNLVCIVLPRKCCSKLHLIYFTKLQFTIQFPQIRTQAAAFLFRSIYNTKLKSKCPLKSNLSTNFIFKFSDDLNAQTLWLFQYIYDKPSIPFWGSRGFCSIFVVGSIDFRIMKFCFLVFVEARMNTIVILDQS